MPFMSSYAKVTAGLCPATSNVVDATVKMLNGITKVVEQRNLELSAASDIQNLANVTLPPTEEGGENPVVEAREDVKRKIKLVQQEIETGLRKALDWQENFTDRYRATMGALKMSSTLLNEAVEEAVSSLKSASDSDKAILTKIITKPAGEQKKAIEALDPSGAAGLGGMVDAVSGKIKQVVEQKIASDKTQSQRAMRFFEQEKPKLSALEREAAAGNENVAELAKELAELYKGLPPAITNKVRDVHDQIKNTQLRAGG